MKKTTETIGILTALIIVAGVICKTWHFPGANIMLIFGISVMLSLFLVFSTILKAKDSQGLEKVMHIIKNVAYFWLAFGILFGVLHYPLAIILQAIGLILFVLVYLPIKYSIVRKKYPEKSAIGKLVTPVIILALVFAYGNRNMSNKIFEAISNSDIQVRSMTASADSSMTHLMTDFDLNKSQFPAQFSTKYSKAVKIKHLSDSLIDFLNICKTEVTQLTKKEDDWKKLNLDELSERDNFKEPTAYFVGITEDVTKAKAFEIKKRMMAMNDSIKAIVNPDAASQLFIPMNFADTKNIKTGEKVKWELALFSHTMLINDLAYLDVLILNIKQTEKNIITSWQSDARSEAMWTFWKKYKELVPDKNTK